MAWYHAQFSARRLGPTFTQNPVGLTTLGQTDPKPATGTPDSLFGPNIGPIQPGPAWTTAATQPKRLVEPDELTTDTVRTWIEKSKLPTTPTTTLQALVNLRRPTLRLSPVAAAPGLRLRDAPHLLEFSFDCASAQCGVHVHVHLPSTHPDAPAHGGSLRVFEAVVQGGFGRTLGPSDAAIIELARFERIPANTTTNTLAVPAVPANTTAPATAPETAATRRRFTPFRLRRGQREVRAAPTGAAVAVVDTGDKKGDAAEEEDDGKGVRVTIRLVALDAEGHELDAPNEHTVYLVVGRLGAVPIPPTATTTETPAEDTEAKDADGENDNTPDPDGRPWLVRVVKREATIGPHTFHLHEIYGLSSAAAATPTPAATPVTYPPQPAADEPPERECLLCLSAPREVVLLPCRHLVACRPCAVNMVEFGAGGAIAPEEAPAPTPAPASAPTPAEVPLPPDNEGEAEPAEASPADNATPVPAAATTAAPAPVVTTRRKRKAKGWFCPVCRQPYTSLLRITTSPPPPADAAPTSPTTPAVAPPMAPAAIEEANSNGGGLLSGLRPAFLRGLSIRDRAPPRDVEAQA
ncbi:RING-type domain-containing protein [Mycena indigotica]|uniref:RING-type domain-containing protein n=1 Tax=Mycena indigotica TaxID=2126181 RepID=A0A8H6TG82_9AGAR|nr:RING-type domain-containing protein [Mycena indigotica]KAF7316177.1 RING-type domain-containing protein [Mycena indigotica]